MASILAHPAISKADMLSDHYLLTTSVAYAIEWQPLKFRILAVRDLATDPITPEAFIRRPMARRSRFQLGVVNLETDQTRWIYQRCLLSSFRECPLRVGVFEGSEMIEQLPTNWGPSVADRRNLAEFLGTWRKSDFGGKRLGIFSDDGEVITAESLVKITAECAGVVA